MFKWFEPSWMSWIPAMPTKAEVAYHLGIGGLTWYGVTSHVAPWISLIAFGVCVVTACISMVLAKLPVTTPQTTAVKWWTKLVAIISGVLAIVFFGVYFSALQHQAQAYSALNSKVVQLEQDLGCLERPDPNEQNLFACVPALQRDAEAAKEAAIANQQAIDLKAQADLAQQLTDTTAAYQASEQWKAAHEKDNGALPKNVQDYFQHLRDLEGRK